MKSMFSGGIGAGGNMYYGRDIGLHGASRNYSSYVSSKKYPKELSNIDDEEEEVLDDIDDILECRVYKQGKYSLLETLENIVDNKDEDKDEDEDLDEFSGASAVAGYVTPLRGSKKDLKKQYQVGFGTKFS